MFTVEIDGKAAKAEVTFYTAYIYEAEFKSDLIQDLFGVQTADPTVGFNVEDDGDGATVKVVSIDFTKIR